MEDSAVEELENNLHIAMFPWLAFGHIIPFVELAKLIAQKGHRISFISTPTIIDRLPKLPPDISPQFNLIELPLPHVQGLPVGAEATTDLPSKKVPLLKKAYDLLRDPVRHLLESLRPDWVIYDYVPHWLGEISRRIGIQTAFFSTCTAATLVFMGTEFPGPRSRPEDFTSPPEWVPFPSNLAFREFEVSRIFEDLSGGDGGGSVVSRIVETLKGCDVIAVRGSREVEIEWLRLLEDLHRKPVLPIGQLPRTLDTNDEDRNDEWKSAERWLDRQRKGSVVYVAFGTEVEMSREELAELALGLEISRLPFFWVVSPRGCFADKLPEGFEDRVRGHGLICTTWAPQARILAHESVATFVTHAGWSSVVEALQNSRALVLLACSNEQGLNVRLLEEKGIGYPVPRNDSDGFFTRDAVAESVRMVAVEERGKVYRDKAKEMSFVFGDLELQHKYVDEFLGFLMSHK